MFSFNHATSLHRFILATDCISTVDRGGDSINNDCWYWGWIWFQNQALDFWYHLMRFWPKYPSKPSSRVRVNHNPQSINPYPYPAATLVNTLRVWHTLVEHYTQLIPWPVPTAITICQPLVDLPLLSDNDEDEVRRSISYPLHFPDSITALGTPILSCYYPQVTLVWRREFSASSSRSCT